MKRHGKLDKQANELADELDRKLKKFDQERKQSEDTLGSILSSGPQPTARLARRHSVDVINVGAQNRRGSTASSVRRSSLDEEEEITGSPRRSQDDGTGNSDSRRPNMNRRFSVDHINVQQAGNGDQGRRFSVDLANLHKDGDVPVSDRGRSDSDKKPDPRMQRRMSLPALYLSNTGHIVKNKDDSNRGFTSSTTSKTRKPPKRTPMSLAQLRSDPNHCNQLLRRSSADDQDDVDEDDPVQREYEAIKNCRYIRRPSAANEELSIDEIFS